MPPSLGRATRRVSLVLFESDAALMERRYGRGWTEQLRRMVAESCREYRTTKSELDRLFKEAQEEDDAN